MAGLNAIGGASRESTAMALRPLLVSTIVIAVVLRVAWVLGVRSVFGRVKAYLAATSRRR